MFQACVLKPFFYCRSLQDVDKDVASAKDSKEKKPEIDELAEFEVHA